MFKLLNKSQIWYFDFILALSIFVMILVLGFRYVINSNYYEGKEVNNIIFETSILSDTLMGPGLPINWTAQDVISIGIVDENTLNLVKLERLNNFSIDDYTGIKHVLGINSDFLVYFTDKNDIILNLTIPNYIGKSGYTIESVTNLDVSELISVQRYVTYKSNNISNIISMRVVLWQE